MLRHTLLLVLFTLTGINVFATHYRGAEITYRITGNYQIEATVTTYTKTSGQSYYADRDSITLDWGDGTTSILPRVNGANDGTCAGASPCGVTIATDIRQNIYTGTHTYAGAPTNADFYTLSFSNQSLIGGIANLDNGNSININVCANATVYMGSLYNALPGGYDASPVLLNPSCSYAFMGNIFTYNCAAYDPDGDSLSYALVSPMQSSASVVPLYVFPDTFCQASIGQPANYMSMDAQTGQLTWTTPCALGLFQVAIEIREYRCGFYLGSIERNMQIIVLPDNVKSPALSAVHDTILQPGQTLQFPITASDTLNFTDSLRITGGAFSSGNISNRPTFQSNVGNPATGTFSWTPDNSFIRPYSYLYSVIASNNFTTAGPDGTDPYPASTTKSFRVWVQDDTVPCFISGINNLKDNEAQVNIYPNPTSNIVTVQMQQNMHNGNLRVFDLCGQVLQQQSIGTSNKLEINLATYQAGIYFIEVSDNNTVAQKKVVKN